MIKAIIVDDELKAIKNLEVLLAAYCTNVNIIGTAQSAFDAVAIILKEKPDLVFLDVHMPEHNGFDVLENIKSLELKIIFTTAHKDYAIKALRKGAYDYLLKPIDADELQEAINRIEQKTPNNQYSNTLQINVKDGTLIIDNAEIVMLKASGSYTEIYLEQKRILASKLLRELEALLNPYTFYRSHNSYIINLAKIEKIQNEDGCFVVFKNGMRAEVSKKNKEELHQR